MPSVDFRTLCPFRFLKATPMPQLLRKESIRLFEACKEAFFLALIGFAIPRQCEYREPICQGSAEIGLLGASVEQAMSACLVQTFGGNILLQPSGQYKSARRILDEFRELLKSPAPRADFLTDDVVDQASHRAQLLASSEKLGILIAARAGGLHAGRGVTRDVFAVKARDVYAFLQLLAASGRIKSYLSDIACPQTEVKEHAVLIEDLVRNMTSATSLQDQASLLTNVFLVLPDIPNDKPEWLDALRRVTVAPKERDVVFLLDTLQSAQPTVLRKQAATGQFFAVKVDPSNPNAIPIDLHNVKKAYTQLKDQWIADTSNANGRIQENILHLPPDDFVLKVFATGLEQSDIISDSDGDKLPHVDTWCFIASSLSVQGTPRPFWFLVRRTDNLSQLEAHLKRASKLGNAHFKSALKTALPGIQCIAKNRTLSADDPIGVRMKTWLTTAEQARSKLIVLSEADNGHSAEDLLEDLALVATQELQLGQVLSKLIREEYLVEEDRVPYWSRKLAEATFEPEDAIALVEVLQKPDLQQAHTAARKSLALIDFLSFGPPN